MINNQIIQQCRSINLYYFISSDKNESSLWKKETNYLRSKTDKWIIKRNGMYFYNDNKNTYGRNAINFFIKYKDLSFADALAFIKQHSSIKLPHNTEIMYDYLCNDRRISRKTATYLIRQKLVGVLHENNYINIVFNDLNGNNIEATGITKRNYKRRYNPNKFWKFGSAGKDTCYICEGAVDAISLFEILQDNNATYISIGGESNRKHIIKTVMKQYKKVIIAVNNDDEGNKIADTFPELSRIVPLGKDWNDDLKNKVKLKMEVA